jgi:O-antigen ligase/Flp pilus assembly protein TadD
MVGLAFGGVHHSSRAATHAALAVALLFAVGSSTDALQRARGGWGVAIAALLVLLAPAVSWVAARVGGVDGPLGGVQAERGLDAMTHWLLGASTLWAAWASAPTATRLRGGHALWLALGLVLLVFGAAHVVVDAERWLGWFAPQGPGGRLVPPFVNPNHSAAAALLFFPLAFDRALTANQFNRRLMYGALAAAFAGSLVWVGAAAPILALGVELLLIAALSWRPLAWVALAVSPVAAWAALVWGSSRGSNAIDSAGTRLEMWRASLELIWRSPVFGVGPGAFEIAVQPLRTDHRFLAWGHAHNDPLQWIVEMGAVGGLAALVALVAVFPWGLRPSRTLRQMGVGAAGIVGFSVVDFPLQLPFFWMSVSLIVGWLLASSRPGSPPPWLSRAAFVTLATLNLVAGAWQVRSAAVARAIEGLSADPSDQRSLSVVRRLAPWRSEGDQALLRSALASDDIASIDTAILALSNYVDDPVAARLAGSAALRRGPPDLAVVLAERAVVLAPWDQRHWRLRALALSAAGGEPAARAWLDAFAAGVPRALDAGWAILPVGLYWADAVQSFPAGQQAEVASFLVKNGDPDAALLAFQSASQREPGRLVRGHILLLEEMGEHELTVQTLERYLAIRPDDAWALGRLAVALEALGRWTEARESWLKHWRGGASGLGRAARAEAKLGGYAAGLRLWEKQVLLGRRPSNEDLVVFARLHLDAQHADACLKVLATPGLLDDGKSGPAARALRKQCQAPLE